MTAETSAGLRFIVIVLFAGATLILTAAIWLREFIAGMDEPLSNESQAFNPWEVDE